MHRRCIWQIGEIMIQHEWIDWQQLEAALKVQRDENRPVGEILRMNGCVAPEQVAKALAEQYGIRYEEMTHETVDWEILQCIPKHFLIEHRILPVKRTFRSVTVAVSDPQDFFAGYLAGRYLNVDHVEFIMTTPENIRAILQEHYGLHHQAA